MSCCCESEEKKASRQEKYKDMTHDERMSEYKKMRGAGIGMLVAGIVSFGALAGALTHAMGAGAATGTAIGACCGLIFGSLGPFGRAKEIKAIDQELGGGGEAKQEAEVV